MRNLTYTREIFQKYEIEIDGLSYSLVDKTNKVGDYYGIMKNLIELFNSEYNWEGMFTIEDVLNRIENNQKLYILFLNSKEIGYLWINELDSENCFCYNIYVTKKIKRPKNSAVWFISKVYEWNLLKYKKIKLQIESWNHAALRIHLELTKNHLAKQIFD